MHAHLEVVIPPMAVGQDIEQAIHDVMRAFRAEFDNGQREWFDCWSIGGRWTGEHVLAACGQDRMDAFHAELVARKVTVSGIQFGKRRLSPESQQAMVDALWREWFPGTFDQCPLFDHAKCHGDIMPVGNLPPTLKAERLIVANMREPFSREDGGDDDPKVPRLFPSFMLVNGFWNGLNWQDTTWDGLVVPAVLGGGRNSHTTDVTREWLAITVDYHN